MKVCCKAFILLIVALFFNGYSYAQEESQQCDPLNGIYNVGGYQDEFNSLDIVFYRLKCGGVTGPVTINIEPGRYKAESYELQNIKGSSKENIITFKVKDDTSKLVMLGTDIRPTLLLNNVSNVKFEGIMFISGAKPVVDIKEKASDITFTNCSFIGAKSIYDNVVFNITNVPVSKIVFKGCKFLNGSRGINIEQDGKMENNIFITNCIFSNQEYNSMNFVGVNGLNITSNSVKSSEDIASSNYKGITLSKCNEAVEILNNVIVLEKGIVGLEISDSYSRFRKLGQIKNNSITFRGNSSAYTGINFIGSTDYFYVQNNRLKINTDENSRAIFYYKEPSAQNVVITKMYLVNTGDNTYRIIDELNATPQPEK